MNICCECCTLRYSQKVIVLCLIAFCKRFFSDFKTNNFEIKLQMSSEQSNSRGKLRFLVLFFACVAFVTFPSFLCNNKCSLLLSLRIIIVRIYQVSSEINFCRSLESQLQANQSIYSICSTQYTHCQTFCCLL